MVGSKLILVVAQNDNGRLAPVVFDTVTAARKLAEGTGSAVAAVITGPSGSQALAQDLWGVGVGDVYVAEHAALDEPKPESHTLATLAAVRQANPSLVVVVQSLLGRDLAPCLAAKMDTGILMNATELRQNSSGAIEAVCPIYGGGVLAVYELSESPPSVVGFQSGARNTDESSNPVDGRVISVNPGLDDFRDRVKIVERSGTSGPLLNEAKVVVSGGVGIGDPSNYRYIEELAELLGGLPGASRAIVDLGWATKAQQVGLTGTVVVPDLYMAIGISGASQHLFGMSSSKVIVAVNTDPAAPIFSYARYGVTMNCLEFLPAFIEECKKIQTGS